MAKMQAFFEQEMVDCVHDLDGLMVDDEVGVLDELKPEDVPMSMVFEVSDGQHLPLVHDNLSQLHRLAHCNVARVGLVVA